MTYDRKEAKIMERIRDILAIANNAPEGDPERETALAQANRLMTRHAIDQAKLDASRTVGEKRVPTQMRFDFFSINDVDAEYIEKFRTLMARIATTNRCRAIVHAGATYQITLVGMQEDVEWAQILWMQIYMEFVSKVNPSWDLAQSTGENVARLKDAGYKWDAIWRQAKKANPDIDDLESYDPGKARYLMREYKAFLSDNPDRPAVGTHRHKAYRFSFVSAFTTRVAARLQAMESVNEEEESSSGSALVLVEVRSRVDEEFYRLFPSARPLTREELDAKQKEQYDKDQAFLASLTPAELKRVMRERDVQARKDERYAKSYWKKQDERMARLDHSDGARAGRAAADEVNLSRATAVQEETREAIEG